MNEEQTKLEKITPAIQTAGWGTVDQSRILMEQTAYLIAPGRVGVTRGRGKKADYVLVYRGRKLVLIEAKSDEKDVAEGVEQAKDYASRLNLRFAYSANGKEIYFMDMLTGEEGFVDRFMTPEEAWTRTFPIANQWRDIFIEEPFWSNPVKTPRYYQENAVNAVLEAIAAQKKRILLTLATGTGKTFIAFQIAWKLFKTKWNLQAASDITQRRQPRILFLSDRNLLANQAYNDFEGFTEDSRCRLTPNTINRNNGRVPQGASIYFTIFQTFASGESQNYKQYPPDFFDLVIVDECHRGGAQDESEWRSILEYFEPAYQLGMTATPRHKVNANTYLYFGKPVYTYSLKQGIEDGYLTPYRVKIGSTPIDEYRYVEGDIVLEGEESFDKTKTYDEKDFYHGRIKIRERDELRVREFLNQINPDEKTLVFCASQLHAKVIRDMINRFSKKPHPYYCVRVTADDGTKGEEDLGNFQENKPYPVILTTSQKLSTGVNARNIRNIVLFRPINDIVEFKQIIGRGTRLYNNKYFFTIYDFVRAHEHFNEPGWDGDPICSRCGCFPCQCDSTPGPGGGGKKRVCPVCGQRPCICEHPLPPPCPVCGNSPCTCSGGNKTTIVIKLSPNRELKVLWDECFWFDGQLIHTDEFINRLYGRLGACCGSPSELREKWSTPETRQAFLKALEQDGFAPEKLQRLQILLSAENCDMFDVLEYIAFNEPMLAREQRARLALQRLKAYSLSVNFKTFLSFVLEQYVTVGTEVLSKDKLSHLLDMKYGSLLDGLHALESNPEEVARIFSSFQRQLYIQPSA